MGRVNRIENGIAILKEEDPSPSSVVNNCTPQDRTQEARHSKDRCHGPHIEWHFLDSPDFANDDEDDRVYAGATNSL